MDAFGELLGQLRARGAFVLRSILTPPWSLRVVDRAPLCLVTMVHGHAWILPDGGEPARLSRGDVALFRGPDCYTLADEPDREVQIVIHPGQRCTTPQGRDMAEAMRLGVRTWGDAQEGAAVMLSGTYQLDGDVSQRLLRILPPVLTGRTKPSDAPRIALLSQEIARDEPGQELILDRLLDLLLVSALRQWLSSSDAPDTGWYRAQHDPIVGPAIRLLHANPAYPWTVANLAARVGVSRAALARRFTSLVGEGPMTYLSSWRLDLAADMLRESDATVASVARQVGYSSAYALSAAFKRVRGVSPSEHREVGQAVPAEPRVNGAQPLLSTA
ncbi:AraC family transcriptional regulator [Natronosporangium hydrolyticum]|uniref:AraC family transcriptional regulator n=1 Tax=Natronosporangium hydrolyticum TaxID=2811111 RepID=A0A895YNB3_9ACTN|nr:AraC family transcriptional regulator [Natronosporangium hydrolyticum]QSB16793.1 AraC family transcriptional regulator [Natronosporangium hydrolyticum]